MNIKENFKTSKDFAIEIIAEGSFVDVSDGLSSAIYENETKTIRLNRVAMREWWESEPLEEPEDFKTLGDWYTYADEKSELRANLENKLCRALGYDDWDSFTVVQVLNNIFTVVAVKDITKSSDAE